MLELLRAPGDPFSRDHFHPGHFTASAFVLSPEGTALLLIFHGRLHAWLQPGGHVEPDDSSLLDAAVREVEEETGLRDMVVHGEDAGIFDVDVHPIPPRKHEPPHQHFDVRFLLQASERELRPGPEVGDARWVELEEIPSLGTDTSVLRAVEKLSDHR